MTDKQSAFDAVTNIVKKAASGDTFYVDMFVEESSYMGGDNMMFYDIAKVLEFILDNVKNGRINGDIKNAKNEVIGHFGFK